MCCKNKLLYCISIKTACLVLSIINVMINLLNLMWYALVWGVILIMYMKRGDMSEMYYYESDSTYMDSLDSVNMAIGGENMDYWMWTWKRNMGHAVFYFGLIPLTSLLTAIFSFVLCIGICNRNPRQVSAYLVYGIVITVLGALASITLLIVDNSPQAGLWVLFVCVIHSLFLMLVLMTHKEILEKNTNSSKFADNIRLIVEDDRVFKSGGLV